MVTKPVEKKTKKTTHANGIAVWYEAFWDLGPIIVCSNDKPRLTMTFFLDLLYGKVKLGLMLSYDKAIIKSFDRKFTVWCH